MTLSTEADLVAKPTGRAPRPTSIEAMRALVVGMGSIGQRHLELLKGLGVRQLTVQSRRPDAVRDRGVPVVASVEAGLDGRPHLVLVCTTADARVAVARAAARAGAHLFLEKPLSNRIDGVAELEADVAASQATVCAGFDLRFDPGLGQVKAWLAAGRIGRVLSVQAQVGQYLPDWRPGRDYRDTASARAEWGGGPILELSHELDYVCWLLGAVEEVSCLTGQVSDLGLDVEDVAVIALRFGSGAIGSVHLDFLQRTPTRTCRLIGDRGTIEWDYHAALARLRPAGTHHAEDFRYPAFTRHDRFAAQMRHVVACVTGGETPRAGLDAAVRNLRLALAARRSAADRCLVRP